MENDETLKEFSIKLLFGQGSSNFLGLPPGHRMSLPLAGAFVTWGRRGGVIPWQRSKLAHYRNGELKDGEELLFIASPALSFATRFLGSWNLNFRLWRREHSKLRSNSEMAHIWPRIYKNNLADGMAQWVRAIGAKPDWVQFLEPTEGTVRTCRHRLWGQGLSKWVWEVYDRENGWCLVSIITWPYFCN